MKLIPIALFLALSTGVANAEESWFEVELILFERHNEQSAQQPHQQPHDFNDEQRLDLITAQLYPSYAACPELSQYQRYQLAAMAKLPPLSDTLLDDAVAVNDSAATQSDVAEPEIQTPIICHAPRELLLAQAYQLRNDRLAALEPLVETELPLQQPPELGEKLVATPQVNTYDPLVYHAFPIDFVDDGISYTSTAPKKVQTVEQVPTRLVAESLSQKLESTHLLPAENLEMIELAKKMRWQKSLTPILHTAWRQPVYARHLAKEYRLFGGINYALDFSADGSAIPEVVEELALVAEQPVIAEPSDSAISLVAASTQDQFTNASPKISLVQQAPLEHLPMTTIEPVVEAVAPSVELDQIIAELKLAQVEEQLTTPLWQLDGAIKIYLNRFLFIENNFELRTPGQRTVTFDPIALTVPVPEEEQEIIDSPITDGSISLVSAPTVEPTLEPVLIEPAVAVPTTKQVAWLNSSQLVQNRRVRSKEIHYFDHPRFGMVIQIRRFEIEQDLATQQLKK